MRNSKLPVPTESEQRGLPAQPTVLGGNMAGPAAEGGPDDDLESFLSKVRDVAARRWKGAAAVAAATFFLTQALAFVWPATFAAQARLLIQKPRASIMTPLAGDTGQAPTVISAGVTEEEVNSEIAILTSREVLASTVTAAGLDHAPTPWYLRVLFAPLRWYEHMYARYQGVPEPTPLDRAIQGLGLAVTAERVKASNIIAVALEARDPAGAEAVLNELLKNYVQRHIEILGRSQMMPFLSDQAGVVEGKLRKEEETLQEGKRKGGTIDPGIERDVQLKMDGTLREEEEMLRRRKAELNGKLQALTRMQSQTVKAREITLAVEGERTTVMAEQAGLEARMKALEAQIAASRERLMDLDRRSIDVTRNQRRVRAFEERYLSYLSRSEQARIDLALDVGQVTNVSMVQAASASAKPTKPKRLVALVVSVVGGFLAGLAWAAWLELRTEGLGNVLRSIAPSRW